MDQTDYRAQPTKFSPVWLLFRRDSREAGSRVEMAGETAWFYNSFTLLSSVQGGYRHFDRPGIALQRVPFSGFQVSTTYFLTGEAFTNREDIRPLRDFRLSAPFANPGAWEVYARYAELDVGKDLVEKRIATPFVSTYAVQTIDVGATWYQNIHSTFYFNWQHSLFASPVFPGSIKPVKGYDLFTLRFQFLL